MKTIKFKLHLTDAQIEAFDQTRLAVSKVWNVAHAVAMHNRSIEWWKWAEKVSKKDKTWSLDGATMTQIKLGPKNAYVGAYCEVKRSNGYWAKDKTQPMIEYRGKEIKANKLASTKPSDIWWSDWPPYSVRCKHPNKSFINGDCAKLPNGEWVEGATAYERCYKHPYTKWIGDPIEYDEYIGNRPFHPMVTPTLLGGGKPITKLDQLDSAGLLKLLGLDLPSGISDYVGGVLKQFEASYAAWLDVGRPQAHKPRWRDLGRSDKWSQSLYNAQSPPKTFKRDATGEFVLLAKVFGPIRMYDGEMDRIPDGMVPRSYVMKVDASGYYLCVTYATAAEVAKVRVNARKQPKGLSDDEKLAFNAQKKADKEYAESVVAEESYNPGNGKTLGIDPGVKRQITAHDGKKTFHIKLTQKRQRKRSRLNHKINDLKRSLSRMKTRNNLSYGIAIDTRRSAGSLTSRRGDNITLKYEADLQRRIARLQLLQKNRRSAYQHRVCVRLFTMGYSVIKYEDTQLNNMIRRPQKKPLADGSYAKNKASAKGGLNRSLADTAMSAQSDKIKTRFTQAGRTFHPVSAKNTSQKCHCCKAIGNRETQALFLCLNRDCGLFNIPQNADDNAAMNIYSANLSVSKKTPATESLE